MLGPMASFNDLSIRATIFRSKLMEEFQLLDNINEKENVQTVYNSKDVSEPGMLEQILIEAPHQFIKFQIFKRTMGEIVKKKDRRLTRMKNKRALPIGAWANWVVERDAFQTFMLYLILANSIMLGVQSEMSSNREKYWLALEIINLLDNLTLIMFIVEIILKWIDDFKLFWQDGWNVFDFIITLLSALPELIMLVTLDDGGSKNTTANTAKHLRAFRILRSLKMVVRFGSLRIIVLTILQAFQSMAFIMLLLFIVAYIFAIIAVNVFSSVSVSERTDLVYKKSFSTLPWSLATLFQLLTLDHWFAIYSDLAKEASPVFTSIYILLWVWVGAFIFRNIFVGVMVNNFHNISTLLSAQRRDTNKKKELERMRLKLENELNLQGETSKSSHAIAELSVNEVLQNQEDAAVASLSNCSENHAERSAKSGDSLAQAATEGKERLERKNGSRDCVSGTTGMNENDRAELHRTMSHCMINAQPRSIQWDATVANNLLVLLTKRHETLWPRDTLFQYFQAMETLQENMKEYQELQMLAAWVIMELHDN